MFSSEKLDTLKENDEKPKSILLQEVFSVKSTFDKTVKNTDALSSYLNDTSNDAIEGKTSQDILIGKENSSLIVMLKQLADNIFKTDMKNLQENSSEMIRHKILDSQETFHCLQILNRSSQKYIENLEYIVQTMTNKHEGGKGDNCISTDVSSFLTNDVVTSSPFNSFLS